MKPSSYAVTFVILILALSLPAPAQRNALGHRLQALESVWGANADAEARRRALPKINQAVRAFFTFRLATAGQALDQARLLVASAKIDPIEEFMASLAAEFNTRLVAPKTGVFEITVDAFYAAGSAPEQLKMTAWLESGKKVVGEPLALVGPDLPFQGRLVAPVVEAALDCDLVIALQHGELEVARLVHAVAVVPDLDARLQQLKAAAEVTDERPKLDWRRATIDMIATDLEDWRAGKEPEEEPRLAAMLLQAEALISAAVTAPLPVGESRLNLPVEKRLVRCRLAVPKSAAEDRPLLLLLHGAGGSESMFFEALGRGVYVQKGLAAGAVVLAPRLPLFGSVDLVALIDSLHERIAFDKSKVLVVGHSMGAGLALNAARRHPERFQALAAIAGGRPMRSMAALAQVPIFLGTGADDFGRDGVLALAQDLKKLKAARLVVVDRELTEHLMVVQDLADAVFEFFAN